MITPVLDNIEIKAFMDRMKVEGRCFNCMHPWSSEPCTCGKIMDDTEAAYEERTKVRQLAHRLAAEAINKALEENKAKAIKLYGSNCIGHNCTSCIGCN